MIAAAFLVLLRPLSLQCVLLLILLLLGTVATILFLCCWHRRLRHEKIPIKSVFSRRSRSREAGLRTHHFRSEVFRHSPRHGRRGVRARVCEERPVVDPAESEPESCSAVRKRKVTKRVQPEFYHSVQVTPTRRPVGVRFPFLSQVTPHIHTKFILFIRYKKNDHHILKMFWSLHMNLWNNIQGIFFSA